MAKNIVDIILRARADTSAARKELDALFRSTEGASINSNQALKLKEEWLSTKKVLEDYASALESIDEQTANATDTKAIEKMGKAAETAFGKFLKLWKGLDQNNLINTKSDPLIDKIKTTSGALAKLWGQFEKTKMPEFDSSSGVTENFASEVNKYNEQFSEAVINRDAAAIDQLLIKYNQLITKATQYRNQSKDTHKQEAWKNAITSLTEFVSAIEESNGEIIRNNSELAELKIKADAAAKELEDMRSEANGVADSFKEGNVQISNFNQTTSRTESEVSELINQFARFTTIAGALEIVTNAIRSSYQAVKELDEAMNSIAVVTDMTTQDLWDQIDAYTELATATGSTIKGSYEVAQLYYQQGLNTADVMTATEETLKMARIAQIDYASATDYATAAIKGFNLAHEDLAHINDVYSNLAAKTAADTEEISIAMSKVASIAHSTGMELETTAAFLTQIISTTREAPETAGTALKTVIARFSEVKELISQGGITGTDEEGEEINVNKIEGALKTAGVQLRDTAGQMRDLDDVFLELASKWDSLDTMQQRYIATQAAGSRQQSRFLALMNNYDELMATVGYATDAAGASNEQFEKTLDSLESKLNALSNAWVEFTTGIADSRLIKGAVDFLTMVLEAINEITGALGEVGTPLSRIVLLFGGLRVAGGALGSVAEKLGFEKIAENVGKLNQLFGKGTVQKIGQFKDAWKTGFAGMADAISEVPNATVMMEKTGKAAQWLSQIFQKAGQSTNIFAQGLAKLGVGGTAALAIAGITAIIAIIDHFYISAQEAAQAYEEYTAVLTNSQSKIKKYSNQVDTLNNILEKEQQILDENNEVISQTSWEELSAGVDEYGRNINLTTEEFTAYQKIANELVGMGLASSYEELNQKLSDKKGYLNEINNQLKEQIRLEALIASREFGKAEAKGMIKEYQQAQDEYTSLQSVNVKRVQETPEARIQRILDLALSEEESRMISADTSGLYEQIFAPLQDEQGNVSGFDFNLINADNIKAFESYRDYLLTTSRELGVETNQVIAEQIANLNASISEYWGNFGKLETAEASVEQASQAIHSTLLNELNTSTSFLNQDSSLQNALIEYIKKNFAIDESTTPQIIEEWKNTVAGMAAIDWSTAFINSEAQSIYNTFFEMLPAPDETAAEWIARYQQALQIMWNGLSKSAQGLIGGEEAFYSMMTGGRYSSTGYNSSFIDDLGIASTLSKKGNITSSEEVKDYLTNNLSGQAWQDLESGIIDINSIFNTDPAINSIEKLSEKIEEASQKVRDFADIKISSKPLEELADAARDVHNDIKDIDLSVIADDGILDDTEKYTEEYYNLVEAFDALRESQDGNFEAAEQTIEGVNLSSEALAQEMIAAQGDATAFLNLQAAKLFADMTGFNSSAGTLNGDAVAAWTAGEAWNYAAQCKAAYGEADSRTVAAVAYASMVTAVRGGGVSTSGGGGGGSSKEPAKAEQDPFYNYIKQAEQYENALKRLENQWEILSNPADLKANLNEQEEAIIGVMAANQAYLTEVNSSLSKMQADMTSKFGKYLSFAEDGSIRLNENYFNATGKIVEEMDAWIDQYDDILGRQTDLNDELDDYKKQLKDLWEGWRDDYIDLTDQLAEIYQERDEKILEEKEEYYETLEEQDKKYLESVRRNIDAERKARQKARTYEDLADKQKRLAMLERDTSGRYTNEVLQLREEISQTQQDMADSEVDEVLEALERQNEEEAERHKEILEAMQQQIDENIENRVYIERAEETIAMGDKAILDALMTGEEYLQSSNVQRQKMIDEWSPQIANATQFLENYYTSADDYIKQIIESMHDVASEMAAAIGEIDVVINNYGGGGGGGTSPDTGDPGNTNGTQRWDASVSYAGVTAQASSSTSEQDAIIQVLSKWYNSYTSRKGRSPTDEEYTIARSYVKVEKRYKKGGLVNYTGPAWVDGTPGNPEAFLNADQTRIIGEFAQHLSRIVNNHIPSFSSPMVASSGGDCNITIEIGSLGADYDIDKAIAKVKDEIVRATSYRGVNIVKRTR